MAKWIEFHAVNDDAFDRKRKTKVWRVVSTSMLGILLGEVRWYPAWKKYSFFPNQNLSTVFECDCLRDIADFCEEQSKAFWAEKRKAKVA